MKSLRREVERVVAPLQASPWRKDRMREELQAHLTNLYEDERTRLSDSDALAAALSRFGEPAELTRSLQQSIPRIERIAWFTFPGHDFGKRRPGESTTAHILRTAWYVAAWSVAANIVLIAVLPVIVALSRRPAAPERPSLVTVAAFLGLCTLVQIAAVTLLPLCCDLARRQVASFKTAPHRRLRHATLAALGWLGATSIGAGGVAIVVALFGPLFKIPIVNLRQFGLVIAAAAAITLFLSLIQSWQQARAAQQFDDLYGEAEVAE